MERRKYSIYRKDGRRWIRERDKKGNFFPALYLDQAEKAYRPIVLKAFVKSIDNGTAFHGLNFSIRPVPKEVKPNDDVR